MDTVIPTFALILVQRNPMLAPCSNVPFVNNFRSHRFASAVPSAEMPAGQDVRMGDCRPRLCVAQSLVGVEESVNQFLASRSCNPVSFFFGPRLSQLFGAGADVWTPSSI